MKDIKQLFFRGLIALLPLMVTVYVLYFLFTFFDNLLGNFIENLIGKSLPGIGIIISIFVILITGFIVTNY